MARILKKSTNLNENLNKILLLLEKVTLNLDFRVHFYESMGSIGCIFLLFNALSNHLCGLNVVHSTVI